MTNKKRAFEEMLSSSTNTTGTKTKSSSVDIAAVDPNLVAVMKAVKNAKRE
jgi:hypothetical protein